MSKPKTINGLMKHLRNDCNIKISGSSEKRQLINYGYFHGYKGYRFFGNDQHPLPLVKYEEVVALIEYDNAIKAMLYPALMFIETSLKNIVCNESIQNLSKNTFDAVFKNKMNDNLSDSKLQQQRLKLRNTIYKRNCITI